MEKCKTRAELPSWIRAIAISLAPLVAVGLLRYVFVSVPGASSKLGENGGTHRVVGYSMEPSLRGSRLAAVCSRCDAKMRVFESRGAAPLWLCPHCGEPLKAGGAGRAEGERVVVRPLGPADRVERDDLVVFRDAQEGQWHVKRVVGLPGERLAIDHGNLTIDGQVIRKSVWRFMKSATLLAVWHPDLPESDRWDSLDCQEAVLSYRHRSPWPRKAKGYALQPTAVTDEDWQDSDQSWPMVTVDDVGVVLEFSDLSPGFSVEVEGHHPVERWLVKLYRMESGTWQVVAGVSGSPLGQQFLSREMKSGPTSSVRIVVAHVDSAVRVGMEGGEEHLWPWPLPQLSQAGGSDEHKEESVVSAAQPLQIRWSKGAGQLTKAWVVRDVHYRGPHGETTWEATVPAAHLYVLGDHPSGSLDSRQQGPLPLDPKTIFGRVEALGSWSERLKHQETDLGALKVRVFP